MARSNRKQPAKKPAVEGKFLIIIGSLVMFGSLAFFISIMGADFGLFRIGNELSFTAIPWIIGICLTAEYVIDILYARRLHFYCSDKNSFLDFIPIVNSLQSCSKIMLIASGALTGLALMCWILIATPLSQLLPATMLSGGMIGFVYFIIIALVAIIGIRGYEQVSIMRTLMHDYMKLSGEYAKTTQWTTIAQSMAYFIPVLRCTRILQDMQFMTTVKLMVDANDELE